MAVLTSTVDPGSDAFRQNRQAMEVALAEVEEQLALARAGASVAVNYKTQAADAEAIREQNYRWLQSELLRATEGYAIWTRIADIFVERLAGRSRETSGA